jgi:hypothetical protein
MGGDALSAGNDESLAQILSYTENTVRANFTNYLKNNKINSGDLLLLDLEYELDAKLIGNYSFNVTLQNQIIEALKMRVHVARTELPPETKIALWNTILPNPRGVVTVAFNERMEGYHLAAEQGLFDELDYMLPDVYTRYGPLDADFNRTLNSTRMAIEYSESIIRPDGSRLPIIPILSFVVANGPGGSLNSYQPVDRAMAWKQVELIQSYTDVETILWWAGDDNYKPGDYEANITGYYSEVKPVPSDCFC